MSQPRFRAHVVGTAAVLAGTLALASCGNRSTGTAGAPATEPVTVTTSVPSASGPEDHVTWNLPTGEPTTLDPAQSALENVSTVDANLCEGLSRFGSGYSMQPALATSVKQPDDTTFVYELRRGVTFWDGKPMTADDVVYSMQRFLNPALGSSWSAAYAEVDGITKTGPLEVTVKLKQPDALFHWFAATPAMNVVEKAYAERAGKSFGTAGGGIMCTGPYRLGTWKQGSQIELTRNDSYWDADHAPLTKTIDFTFSTDASSQTSALLTGDVQGQFSNSVSSFKQLSSSNAGSLLFGDSLSPTFVQLFANDDAVQDLKVRQALAKVVDYQGIAQSVYGGAATRIKTITPPATFGYSRSIFQSAYDKLPEPEQDIAGAKALMSGVTQTKPITLAYVSASPEESKIALSIQSGAEQAGIKVELKALPPAQYGAIFYDPNARAGLSGMIVTGYLDFPEPLQYLLFQTTGSYYNFGGYQNKQYDQLVFQAQATLDDDARARLLTRAWSVFAADAYTIPIVSQKVNVFVGKGLTGVLPQQSFYYTPWADALGAS